MHIFRLYISNSVKIDQYRFICCAYETYGQTDSQVDSYNTPSKTLYAGV